jgi:hypothetical protein
MIPMHQVNRRTVLRGMLGGSAISVGLPYLDCFLNTNGTALAATGESLPICFGTWFWGLGFNPGRWEPKKVGAGYDMNVELAALQAHRSKMNIYSGMKTFLDGKAAAPHGSTPQALLTGTVLKAGNGVTNLAGPGAPPTLDSIIADAIGTRTRFRSLEVVCDGSQVSYSSRGGLVINPAEPSPLALYTRIFGPDFTDPNAADFKPDPTVMVRKSVLSSIKDERETFLKGLGAGDRARMDEYFTSLRQIEQQLEIELQKPQPLPACNKPASPEQATIGPVIDDVLANHKIFASLLAHALACGQTRVINTTFSGASPNIRKGNSAMTSHLYTHEEPVDPVLGYQPNVLFFNLKTVEGIETMVSALDSIKEGDGTLLDRMLMFFTSDGGFAKYHSLENAPMLTAGRAGGRMKTGIHFAAQGDPGTRVGLTMQQVMGANIDAWGTESNRTSKSITEVMA